MKKKRFCILGIFLFSGFLSSSYAGNLSHDIVPSGAHARTTTIITHYVPPPHTTAHGYQHRYYNHELQFDTGFGAYVVIGNPGLYFHNGYYIRFYSGGWQISRRLGNPWHPTHRNNIPHQRREHHVSRKSVTATHTKKDKHVKRKKHENQHQRVWY